jgi:hypothetical protein
MSAIQHRQQKMLICRYFKPSETRTVDPLLTISLCTQLSAIVGYEFSLSKAFPSEPVAPALLHKCSMLGCSSPSEPAKVVGFDAHGYAGAGLAAEHVGDGAAGCAEDLDVRRRVDGVGVRAGCALGDQFHVEDH